VIQFIVSACSKFPDCAKLSQFYTYWSGSARCYWLWSS